MLGFETARRIASGAADYMGKMYDSSNQPGAPIQARELTGRDFSYGAALNNIGVKIMARARADANAAQAARRTAMLEENSRLSNEVLRAKLAAPAPAAIEHTHYMTIKDAKGNEYRVPDQNAYSLLNPKPTRPSSSTPRFMVKMIDGSELPMTAEGAANEMWRRKRDAERTATADALAEQRFTNEDMPVMARRMAYLMDTGRLKPGQRYSQQLKEQALDYFGINRDAWAAENPDNFPDDDPRRTSGANYNGPTQRAVATARRQAMVHDAVARYKAAKKGRYKSEFLLRAGAAVDPSGEQVPQSAAADDFEERFIRSAPVAPEIPED